MAAPASDVGAAPLSYERAKELANSKDLDDRLRVAGAAGVRPELLFFLAADEAPEVRRRVAGNAGTPWQADRILAGDRDDRVRGALAEKVARLLPEVPEPARALIEQRTGDLLLGLARDQALRVRAVLSEILQDHPNVPHAVIAQLARDIEISVAGRILSRSPLLTDEDLLDIIRTTRTRGAVAAIAGRTGVSAAVSDAIVASEDVDGITALLRNGSAQIREQALDRIIECAPAHPPWHEPLVQRPQLPPHAAIRLAEFVADTLVEQLRARPDFDAETVERIASTWRGRMEAASGATPREAAAGEGQAPLPGADWVPEPPRPGKPAGLPGEDWVSETEAASDVDRARRLARVGRLTEEVLAESLGKGERGFVQAALAELGSLPLVCVERIVASRTPRAVTALAWYAGLSMRFARQMQLSLAQIPHGKVLKSGRDGAFPLTEKEMRWQVELFMEPGASDASGT